MANTRKENSFWISIIALNTSRLKSMIQDELKSQSSTSKTNRKHLPAESYLEYLVAGNE
jgi:hypothetical protein